MFLQSVNNTDSLNIYNIYRRTQQSIDSRLESVSATRVKKKHKTEFL